MVLCILATVAKLKTAQGIGKRGQRIKGICGAAAALGYNRYHLSEVVRGNRISPRLLKLYEEYKHQTESGLTNEADNGHKQNPS